MSKVRTNHEFTKQHEKKVYDVWLKTEAIKKERLLKDKKLDEFLKEKKDKYNQSLKQ